MSVSPGNEVYVSFRSGSLILKACARVVACDEATAVVGGFSEKLGSLTEAVRAPSSETGGSELCFIRVPKESVVTKKPSGWPKDKTPSAETCLTAWAAVTKEAELSSGAEAPVGSKAGPSNPHRSGLGRDLSALGELWQEEDEDSGSSDEEPVLPRKSRAASSGYLPPGASALPEKSKKEKSRDGRLGDQLQQLVQQGLVEGQSPSELMPLLMMSFMSQQQQASRKKKASSSKDWDLLGGSSSDETSGDEKPKDVGMKAVATLHKLHRRVHQHPRKVISSFEKEIIEEMGVVPGQSWTIRDYLRKQSWGKFKGIYRCAVMDAVCYELLRSGQTEAGTAQLVQNMKAKMQSVIQNGDWTSAWLLTGIPDPLSRKEFGGSKEELAVISGYVNALQKIRKQVKEAQTSSHAKEEED